MSKIIIITVLLFLAWNANAQKSISLKEALEQVKSNHPTVLQQDLYIEQQRILKNASNDQPGIQQPMLGAGYTFDEVGISGTGVHSLYVTHSFNLPRVGKNKALLQEELAKAGTYQKEATQKELQRYVASLYQQLLYTKSQQQLNRQLRASYKKIEQLAQKKVDLGETNAAPVLSLQTAQHKLSLKEMRNKQTFQIQLEQLKAYLVDSTITDIQDSILLQPQNLTQGYSLEAHPLVKQIDQSIIVNHAQKKLIQDQLAPQIIWGFRTQMVQLEYPNFGGQIGLNIPLMSKNVKAEVKANELNTRILDQSRNWQIQQLDTRQKIALENIEALEQQVSYLEEVVLPAIQKQQTFMEKSFQIGELDYLSVLQSSQQIISIRKDYWQLLFQLNLAWIEYQSLIVE